MSYLAGVTRHVARLEARQTGALRSFQQSYFGQGSRQADDAFAQWLFERNPNRDPALSSVWVYEREGAIVGQQGSIPVVLKVDDTERRAAWLIDWMVHPDWRLKGVAPALLAASVNSSDIALGLGLEEAAVKTLKRSGWQDVGNVSLFVRALQAQQCAAALDLPVWLRNITPGPLVDGSARVLGRAASVLTRSTLSPVAAFDERVDTLWATASPDYPIVVKRDSASLRWRFDDGPHASRYERYYLQSNGRLVGYAVTRIAPWRGHLVGRVVDYFAERRWLAPLFAQLVRELSAKGLVAMFVEQCCPKSEAALRMVGCLRAGGATRQRFMFKLREPDAPWAGILSQAAAWMVMTADADLDHNLIMSEARD